jgi:hypothetical protein
MNGIVVLQSQGNKWGSETTPVVLGKHQWYQITVASGIICVVANHSRAKSSKASLLAQNFVASPK